MLSKEDTSNLLLSLLVVAFDGLSVPSETITLEVSLPLSIFSLSSCNCVSLFWFSFWLFCEFEHPTIKKIEIESSV